MEIADEIDTGTFRKPIVEVVDAEQHEQIQVGVQPSAMVNPNDPNPFVKFNPEVAKLSNPGNRKRQKPVYDVAFLVGQHRITRFDLLPETREAFKLIAKYNIVVNYKTGFREDELCLPIKITSRGSETEANEDWTRFGSGLQELEYANVIRWWPATIFQQKTRIGKEEFVRIEYPTFVLNGLVQYAYAKEEKDLFKDIKLPSDKPPEPVFTPNSFVSKGTERSPADGQDVISNHKDEEQNTMSVFGGDKDKAKKDKTEKARSVAPITDSRYPLTGMPEVGIDSRPVDQNLKAESVRRGDTQVRVDAKKPTAAKKLPTWAKVAIGVGLGAAAVAVTVHVLKKNYVIV